MPKKLHPADAADQAILEGAVQFNVHLRLSPFEKINRPAPSLVAAIEIAKALSACLLARRPLIYAITADGLAVPVPTTKNSSQPVPRLVRSLHLKREDA